MRTRGAMASLLPLAVGLALAVVTGCASFEAARLYRSGTEALDRGDTNTAIRDLERAAQVAPYASPVQNHLGLAYAAAGRNGEALSAFRRAVELDCENLAAEVNLHAAEERAQ
ncbi:MAG: tetratricopeptide repeat protein [Myxococcota bacterium]|nr:tetratricopeptide repeat protein [bacterium]MDP6075057.1 tetratricopeptide repeat protein [Myxococcota bacterium]MDP6243300.1 tetratricopeptide repeat protein [Myxococcota bacterium]MDP7075613.1 tetratricopeptide repeat protein [Myxococcota bacterium]MDP7301324.1 tetratricopeptide repeat protein [Myxococcota bacterium]